MMSKKVYFIYDIIYKMKAYGAIVRTVRCEAKIERRGPNQGKQCSHYTSRSIYCHQHEKKLRGFRIAKTKIPRKIGVENTDFGLITTREIPKGSVITEYDGKIEHQIDPDEVNNPFVLKLNNHTYIDAKDTNVRGEGRWVKDCRGECRNNAELVKKGNKVFVYAKKNIEPNTEITAKHSIRNDAFKNELRRIAKQKEKVRKVKPKVKVKRLKKITWGEKKNREEKAKKIREEFKRKNEDAEFERRIALSKKSFVPKIPRKVMPIKQLPQIIPRKKLF